MRTLPLSARRYVLLCHLLGLLALSWLVVAYGGPALQRDEWLLAAGLAVVAAICQVLVVHRTNTTNRRADQLTPAPLIAALLLLPSPLLALVLCFTFLPEWVVHRRQWYGQLFNLASYAVAAVAALQVLVHLTGHDRLAAPPLLFAVSPLRVLLVLPVFLAVQTQLLAWVLKLAQGQSFQQSGLFAPRKLAVELGLVCLGLAFAIAWLVDPRYGIAAALPLALIFEALHAPNLREAATTDPKTGLANMRQFNRVIARALEQAVRSGQPLSVLMCDVDHLRGINNTYGHQAGDRVLLGVADVLQRQLRGGDLAARFGGEEFVVLLADADLLQAQQVADRLRRDLAQTRFPLGPGDTTIRATISIGVATYPEHGRTADVLLHEADLAVYQAKREGRNRVVSAGRASRELAGAWSRAHGLPRTTPQAHSGGALGRLLDAIATATYTPGGADAQPRSAPPADQPPDARPDAAPTVPRRPAPSPRVLAFIGAVVASGLLGLWPGGVPASVPWWPLALFATLTLVTEHLAVPTFSRNLTSVAVVAVLSATFLYAEAGILVTAAALAGASALKARSPLHRLLFNFGTVLLAAEGARGIFVALSGDAGATRSLASLIVPALAAGLGYYAINHALLCVVRGLAEHRSPWRIWQAEYRWLWPHYAVLGGLGLVVALGYQTFGIVGVLALMAPVAMMHLAIKQYVDQSTVFVDELRRMNRRLADSYEATLQSLTRALDTRDEETEAHSWRVQRYTQLIAQRLGVAADEVDDITRGALLHDIGKIGVPDAILLKPGPLADEERALMRKHPEIGYGMIAHIPFLARAAQVVLHHHEAYDGSGYPGGLAGRTIPLGARIFAVADAFDAMTSDRPYRQAVPISTALAEIARCRGTQFDPTIVETFLAIPTAELLAVRADRVPPRPAMDILRATDRALAGAIAGQPGSTAAQPG